MQITKLILFITCLIAFTTSYGQWNNNISQNNPICIQNYDQQDARIVSDGAGGAIIGWLDFRNDSINADIYCQRIDKNGFVKWVTSGVAVCSDIADQGSVNITESTNGSTILTWTDKRTGINNNSIFIQKIDSNGLAVWTSNGVNLSNVTGQHQNPKILSDGQGGAFVLFEDSTGISNFDIGAQHITSNGILDWGNTGIIVCNATNKQINPRIETDGNTGFYAVWQDLRNGNDYDIYLQHVNSNGQVSFITNGITICNSSNVQSNPKIEPDGQAGVIIAWVDKRNNNDYDIYTQRVNALGNTLWNSNGIPVCVSGGNQSAIELKSIGSNGVVYAWKDGRNPTYSIYTERFDLNGNSLWAQNGSYISTGINPNLAEDFKGGVLLTWQDSVGISWNVYNTRLNNLGSKIWGGNVIVSNAAKAQIGPKNIGDGLGGAITCWQDKRNGNDYDIYVQHSDSNSIPNQINLIKKEPTKFFISPNPCSNHFNLNNNLNQQIDAIEILSMDGKVLFSQKLNSNASNIQVNIPAKLVTANYVARIISNNNSSTSIIINVIQE